jgi:predicted DNA-binding transcriptional regulator YafY
MGVTRYIERIQRIDSLIRRRSTGTPKELAQTIEMSEASLYRYLEAMKSLGAPIRYDRKKNAYFYYADFKLTLSAAIS